MVKSKKMSKSTVAIVLLSLLLVLSLILTATGAWFTANATKGSDGATLTFGNLSVTGSVSDMEVKLNGADWATVGEDGAIVMPGDKVRGGHYEFTITTNDVAGAYYLIYASVDGADKWYTVSENALVEYESGDLVAVANDTKVEFGGTSDEGAYVGGAEGSAIDNDQQGQLVSVAAGSYTIYVIQASNISADNAASFIKASKA